MGVRLFVRTKPDNGALCPYIGGMIGTRPFWQTSLHIGRSLLLGLLLLVIAAHAAAPLGQPLERAAGSAFSAATADVAVKAGPTLPIAKRIAPIAPPPLPIAPAAVRLPMRPAVPSQPGGGLTAQIGPPAAETSFSPLAARAPPAT